MQAADPDLMQLALEQARLAFEEGEVPVGAVVALDGQVVAAERNAKERLRDPSVHVEVLVLCEAVCRLGRWRLSGCALLVTLEPCVMCMGAAVSARIERLVFGCADPKAGAASSLYRLGEDSRLNHRFPVEGGLLADEAAELLRSFFQRRRVL
jgi:tRNA(adenine34) deaminase